MGRWLIARLLGAVAVVLVTVVACSAIVAILVPDEAPRAGVWGGTVEGVRLKLLHGDFGVSRVEPGSVPVADLFARGVAVDLALLAGGLVAGTALCPASCGSRSARSAATRRTSRCPASTRSAASPCGRPCSWRRSAWWPTWWRCCSIRASRPGRAEAGAPKSPGDQRIARGSA